VRRSRYLKHIRVEDELFFQRIQLGLVDVKAVSIEVDDMIWPAAILGTTQDPAELIE
jgi:hypothetical protein